MTQGKGGGPKTAAGKARSSRNAVKHAIYYFNPVLIEGMETEGEWIKFRDGVVESLAPVGTLEEDIAMTIAHIRWRLRRVLRFETAAINHRVQGVADNLLIADSYLAPNKAEVEYAEPMRLAAHQQKVVIPLENDLNQITRYEAHLHRLWVQNYRELEAIQDRRRGERPHLNPHRRQYGPARDRHDSRETRHSRLPPEGRMTAFCRPAYPLRSLPSSAAKGSSIR